MASKFETGHFKNLSNFGTLLTYLSSQPTYAPDADELKLPQLQDFLTQMEQATNQLITDAQAAQQLINYRQQTFEQARKLAKKIMLYLESNSTDEAAIKDVRTHYNEMQSKRVTKVQTVNEDGSTSEKSYSSNRLSYTSMAEHFQNMVARLKTVPGYAPSDNTIKIDTLEDHSAALHTANNDIASSLVTVTNTRNTRDQLMYSKNTGLVDLALRIKNYLKYKYGTQSDQYHFANSLKYTRKQIRTNDPLPANPPIDT